MLQNLWFLYTSLLLRILFLIFFSSKQRILQMQPSQYSVCIIQCCNNVAKSSVCTHLSFWGFSSLLSFPPNNVLPKCNPFNSVCVIQCCKISGCYTCLHLKALAPYYLSTSNSTHPPKPASNSIHWCILGNKACWKHGSQLHYGVPFYDFVGFYAFSLGTLFTKCTMFYLSPLWTMLFQWIWFSMFDSSNCNEIQ